MNDAPVNIVYLPSRKKAAVPNHPKKLSKRQMDAQIIAKAVLAAICSDKAFREHPGHGFNGYSGGGFTMIYSDQGFAGHYGLEIWPEGSRKVFNIRWDAMGFELPAFKRGSWEQDLLAHIAAALGVSLQDVDPRLRTARVLPLRTSESLTRRDHFLDPTSNHPFPKG